MILTLQQMQDRLKEYTYRPGWKLEVYQGVTEGIHIKITAELEDSVNPGNKVTIEVYSALPYMLNINDLDLWVSWRLKRIEIHESCEWFKINGQCFIDPHGEKSDRNLFQFS